MIALILSLRLIVFIVSKFISTCCLKGRQNRTKNPDLKKHYENADPLSRMRKYASKIEKRPRIKSPSTGRRNRHGLFCVETRWMDFPPLPPPLCACERKVIHVCNTTGDFSLPSSRFCGVPRVLHYRVRVHGLIYSRCFISGLRRRRRGICFMISPYPPLLSLFPLCISYPLSRLYILPRKIWLYDRNAI